MKDRVDITMTAVLRPSLLSETLQTILKHVCKDQIDRFRLIINVDPIGEDIDPTRIIKIAQKNFSDVIYNIADTPSFPHAVKWVWSQATAPFIFHWEDDVDILHPIDIDDMIGILKRHTDISSLRLYKAATPNRKSFRTFACMWDYNKQGFFVARDWRKQFGLNPILIKREFVKEAVTRMVDHTNPEKQFRESQKYMRPLIKKWKYALYTRLGSPRMIDGRKGQRWKNAMKLDKPKGQTFLKWVSQ